MKKILKSLLPGLLLITLATPGFAENRQGAYNLSPFVGGYVLDKDQREEKNGAIFGLRAGYNFTKSLGAEAMFGYSITQTKQESKETDIYRYGVDILYHFMPDSSFVPFIAVGGGGTNFNTPNTPSIESHYAGLVNYGVGLKYFVTDNVALRGDVRHVLLIQDTGKNNLEYSVGLTFQFGGKAKPAPVVAPEPVPVAVPAPVVAPAPKPAPVVAPTPAPAPVVAPVEPAPVVIQPVDSDGDGVPDYLDKCPGTPAGVKVDANGCPEVVVSAQKAAAAERFCSKPAVVAIEFDTKKADIKPQYHDELKIVSDFLKDFPNAKGEISGHSDNVGSKALNQNLSQARAESVKKYLVDTFSIEAARIDAKGYNFSKPVASNKTNAGKAKNRRIEANFTCE